MTALAMLVDEHASSGDEVMGLAALAIADHLTGRDFDVRNPEWDGSHLLKVTNARGFWCEVLVSAGGLVEWECRPCDGGLADPARTAEMVRRVLGGNAGDRPAEALPSRLGFTSIVGRMLANSGMDVSVQAYQDSIFFEVCSEINVTNPVRPGRGRARVADDGLMVWQCRIKTQPGDDLALDSGEIASTIAQALTGTDRA